MDYFRIEYLDKDVDGFYATSLQKQLVISDFISGKLE
jgi:hypothetical protein